MTFAGDAITPLALDDQIWSHFSDEDLEAMTLAGQEVVEVLRVLQKTDGNVVGDILRQSEEFVEWDHYPDGDVYDNETHSQYYYHAHRGPENEHGHFHTFLRKKGMPDHIQPIPDQGPAETPEGDDILTHLIAVSMDAKGFPIHLFTTNRWVTAENWFSADDVIEMLDHFEMDLAWPSWATNRWITAMLYLFRPQIIALLRDRDRVVAQWAETHPDKDVFEDRDLEITSYIPISIQDQINSLNTEIMRRQNQHDCNVSF